MFRHKSFVPAGLVPILLVLLTALPAAAGDETEDALVLASGERVACEIQGRPGDVFVTARIGARTYRFERANLTAVIDDGAMVLRADLLAHVERMGNLLAGPDPLLATSAKAALVALGDKGAPYLEAVAKRSANPAVAKALRALVNDESR